MATENYPPKLYYRKRMQKQYKGELLHHTGSVKPQNITKSIESPKYDDRYKAATLTPQYRKP